MNINPEVRDRIVNAANALHAEGVEEPTNEQVRERMGSGSLSHVSPVMRDWREAQRANVEATLGMPAELKNAMDTSLGQIWKVASGLAVTEIDHIRRNAGATVEAATEERDEALNEISRLEAQMAGLAQTLASEKQTREREQHEGVRLTAENAALMERVEERNTQIEELRAERDTSRLDSKQLQSELIKIARLDRRSTEEVELT